MNKKQNCVTWIHAVSWSAQKQKLITQTLKKLLKKQLKHQTIKFIDRYQQIKQKSDWINE